MPMGTGRIWTWWEGSWHQGDVPVAGAAHHGLWQGTVVFDGARAFEGACPDLDLHCARVNASARTMGLEPVMADGAIAELCREGVAKFETGAEIYVRPMMWSTGGGPTIVAADGETTVMAICLEEFAMPPVERFEAGMSLGLTQFRRPMQSMMPTDAKAGCLYPNNARMLREVRGRGFDNALVQDGLGNVAELATSNVFVVRDGVAATPVPNGTFLNGITRQRVMKLLRDAGVEVVETVLSVDDVLGADEVFSTGNAQKVMSVTKLEDRSYDVGPVTRKARELYWEYALG